MEGWDAAKASPGAQLLSKALAHAETGGEQNPWIRTHVRPPEGSTAYGPLQLTGKLAKEMRKVGTKLFTPKELEYLDLFIEQAKKFAKYGDNPYYPNENVKALPGYDPRYDYGGTGDLDTPGFQRAYWQVTSKWLDRLFKKHKNDPIAVAHEWRFGNTSKKTLDKDDPDYLQKVMQVLHNG